MYTDVSVLVDRLSSKFSQGVHYLIEEGAELDREQSGLLRGIAKRLASIAAFNDLTHKGIPSCKIFNYIL